MWLMQGHLEVILACSCDINSLGQKARSTFLLDIAGSAKLCGSGGAVVVSLTNGKEQEESFREACNHEGWDVFAATPGEASVEISSIPGA